ncbi:hypothetical protein [Tissierella pigra]|uniref:Uncharacterized protein n=1 Tax=Tissierella pigra TaxID=2607614 RepID=A0A6N7XX01_9FIRM|nr:hypothetical protein [Tissierella pigra]MSU02337.1 hypothetical protein [Tissierella pigra]
MKSIVTTAAELIDKNLDYKNLKSNHDKEEALIRAYKRAEQDLMAYIGKQIKSVTTIPELVDCFYHSCYGFGALGRRADLLEEKLIGLQKTPASALDRAITKYVDPFVNYLGFDPLPLPKVGDGLLHDWYQPDQTDWRALASMPLLDYLLQGEYEGLRIGDILSDLIYGTCMSPMLELNWRKRSLVGYYDTGYIYKLDISNKTFIQLFSSSLNKLLENNKSIDALQVKEHMHRMLLKGWTDNHLHDPLTLYADIEKLIDKHKANVTITAEFVGKLMTFDIFAVRKSYDSNFVGYELDYKGLDALADMLKNLGLDNLQGASNYISMVENIVN